MEIKDKFSNSTFIAAENEMNVTIRISLSNFVFNCVCSTIEPPFPPLKTKCLLDRLLIFMTSALHQYNFRHDIFIVFNHYSNCTLFYSREPPNSFRLSNCSLFSKVQHFVYETVIIIKSY